MFINFAMLLVVSTNAGGKNKVQCGHKICVGKTTSSYPIFKKVCGKTVVPSEAENKGWTVCEVNGGTFYRCKKHNDFKVEKNEIQCHICQMKFNDPKIVWNPKDSVQFTKKTCSDMGFTNQEKKTSATIDSSETSPSGAP